MPQVVKELVAQTASHVCAGHQSGDVEKLDGYGAPAGHARAVVWFAFGFQGEAGAGAGDLEVTDRALGVDCREGKVSLSAMVSTGVMGFVWGEIGGLPTLEEASVKLFEDLDCCDFACFGTAWEATCLEWWTCRMMVCLRDL